jgi:hypothetical protein
MAVSGKDGCPGTHHSETIKPGAALCLDFANSVDWSSAGELLTPSTDALLTRDLARWGRRLDVVRAVAGRRRARLEAASATARAAPRLSALAEGRRPRRADLDALARDHASAAAPRGSPSDDGAAPDLTRSRAARRAFAVAVAMALPLRPARLARVHRFAPRAAGSSSTRAAGGGARCRPAAAG